MSMYTYVNAYRYRYVSMPIHKYVSMPMYRYVYGHNYVIKCQQLHNILQYWLLARCQYSLAEIDLPGLFFFIYSRYNTVNST